MSEITIDDLSHENSLIRARNERLEAEKAELVAALCRLSSEEWRDDDDPVLESARRQARYAINHNSGSAK